MTLLLIRDSVNHLCNILELSAPRSTCVGCHAMQVTQLELSAPRSTCFACHAMQVTQLEFSAPQST